VQIILANKDPVDYYGKRVFVGGHGPVTKTVTILDSQARKAIMYLLAVHGPLTLKELSEMLQLSPSTVHDHLRKLKEAGIIKEAEEYPKKFKVEIYYRLNIPYLLFSELTRLENALKVLIDEFSTFIEKTKSYIASNVENLNLRCLTYKDPLMYERVILALLVRLFTFVFSKYINEPIVYVLINDLEEKEPTPL
jgi:DNA-binding transcriptional ArsR family regulator